MSSVEGKNETEIEVVREHSQRVLSEDEQIKTEHWYDGFVRLFIWYPSYLEATEKKLLIKIDVFILTYVCCSYFTKSLDKSNITNAYVSGMEVDIGFRGNDLSYAKSLYSAGYIVSMCFGMLFVTRPWAKYMLPILETIWGVLTFCEAAAKTPSQMFALRFLIGFAEGPIFPAIVYTLGCWYRRDEIYRRIMVFSISASLGGIFSGFLQSSAYSHLSGKGGLAGWKWGFIIDGILTVPIALMGFIFFPGTVEQAKNVFWLNSEDWALAKLRVQESGVRFSTKLSFSLIKRVFFRWHVHYFTAFWVLLNVIALPDGTGFPLWLYSLSPEKYSVSQVNNYPSIESALSIVVQFIFAGLSDTFSIYPFLIITQLVFVVSYASLTVWNIPIGWRWFCFLVIGFDGVDQAIVSGHINRACRRDAEERAFVLGFSDAVSQAINIWTNIVFFPTSKAPEFHLGYIISLVGALIMLFLPIIAYFGEKWDDKHYVDTFDSISIDPAVLSDEESTGEKAAHNPEPLPLSIYTE